MKIQFFYWLKFTQFLILTFFLTLVFFVRHIEIYNGFGTVEEQNKSILICCLLLLQLLIILKQIKTQYLAKNSNVFLVFFILLFFIIPLQTFQVNIFIIAILLSLFISEILKIPNDNKHSIKVIFNAGLILSILFFFFTEWAFFYFLVIWIVFIFLKILSIQNILVSCIPIGIVFIIHTAFLPFLNNYLDIPALSFSVQNIAHWNNTNDFLTIGALIVIPLITIFSFYIISIISAKGSKEIMILTIFIFFIITFIFTFFVGAKTGNESILLLFPICLFLCNFIEVIPTKFKPNTIIILFVIITLFIRIKYLDYTHFFPTIFSFL